MRKSSYAFLLGSILMIGCSEQQSIYPPTTVEDYLNSMIDIMEQNHIRKSTIDWAEFRALVLQDARGSATIADAESSVLYALELLNDQSTFVITVNGNLLTLNVQCEDDEPSVVVDDADIGYIKIPAFTKSGLDAAIFAEGKQNEAKAQDKADLKGWIVDIRGNTGGNLWPMIAGLGPILGEGLLGNFVNGDAVNSPFSYSDGSAIYDESPVVTVLFPYTILSPDAKVAVLVDNATSNAAEAVAIAFSGKANTKSFGDPTCGQGGGNQTFALLDGSSLFLNVAFLTDRNSKQFLGAYNPDEVVSDPTMVYNKAVEWINE
ncbi:MAG: S41 family peptidase [Cyclobacteriaceae bacterium]